MQKSETNTSLTAKLESLFSFYNKEIDDESLKEIIQRGFAFSNIDYTADILIMGINPSQRVDFLSDDGISYNFKELKEDRYFKKFHALTGNSNLSISYLDLFYQKHSEQKEIERFLANEKGRMFLKEQLTLTHEIISKINPKLILLFNRKAGEFFTTEWLGYELKIKHKDSRFRKSGIDNIYNIKDTSTMIYLSTFLGYRTRKASLIKVENDVPKLLELIKIP